MTDHVTLSFEYLYIGMPWYKDIYSTSSNNTSLNPGTDDYVSWATDAHLGRIAAAWQFN